MKRIRAFVLGLLACAVCGVLAYHFGYNRALRIQDGTLRVSYSAIEDLRTGQMDTGTRKVEDLCFGAADLLYGNPSFRNDPVCVLYASGLKQYRATYRTNSADWSIVEQDLDKELANWK